MKRSLLLLCLLPFAELQVKAQQEIVRQNILLERYTNMRLPVTDGPDESKLEKDISKIRSHVIRINHYWLNEIEVPFALEESQAYARGFCAGEGTWYTLDRTKLFADMAAFISFSPSGLYEGFYQEWLAEPTNVSIRLEAEYDKDNRKLTARVSGLVKGEVPRAKINLFLTQDDLYIKEIGKAEPVRHDDVLRAIISTGLFGDSLKNVNGKYSQTYTYVIPKEINGVLCDPYKMSLVAFVADKDMVPTSFVRNSTRQRISDIASVGTALEDELHVCSDHGTVYISKLFDRVDVYTAQGRLVKVAHHTDSFYLDQGFYILHLNKGRESTVRKIIVTG